MDDIEKYICRKVGRHVESYPKHQTSTWHREILKKMGGEDKTLGRSMKKTDWRGKTKME